MALENIHLTPQLVQAVRDAVDVVEIVSDHVKLRRSGRRYVGLCPLHREKTPSFSVDPEQGLFYCFGCGKGGDAIKLHMMLSGDDFVTAIETLARRYGIPLPTRSAARGGKSRTPDLEPVLAAAESFFREQLEKTDTARAYLAGRKVPPELIEEFRLGYAPTGWQNLVDALHPKFPLADLEAVGLIGRSEKNDNRPYDRFRDRLMFPVRAASGRLVGFGGRTLVDDKAKYINSSETEYFHKGNLLYGLDRVKRTMRETGNALLVEGYFDVIGARAAGVEVCVASMGTALTPEQARLLGRFATDVVVGYDGDSAGQQAARRALSVLLERGVGVRRMSLAEGQDPDSLRLSDGPEAVIDAFETAPDFVTTELERLIPSDVATRPQAQGEAARRVADLLRPIGDTVLRYAYVRQAAGRLGVPVEILWQGLGGGGKRPSGEQEGGARDVSTSVRSVEEKVLQLLLRGEELQEGYELPVEEVFFDEVCRNIYRSFCALYRGSVKTRPESQQVVADLVSDQPAVDRVARLLLEDPSTSEIGGLAEALDQLVRRWRRRRLQELAAAINQAQRAGDQEKLEELVQEKTELSRAHHYDSGSPKSG